jgi:hypothetical protein
MTAMGDSEVMTCEQVDQGELDLRYLRGELDPGQAEAFEAHYFGCDRCWNLVRAGNQLRSARSIPSTRPGSSRKLWWLTAAAAFIATVSIGLWRQLQRDQPVPVDSLRSSGPGLAAPVARILNEAITLDWRPVPQASSYRVRLFRGDGTLLIQREVRDTAISVSRDSLGGPALELVWQVHALDRLGGEIARLPLTTVRP